MNHFSAILCRGMETPTNSKLVPYAVTSQLPWPNCLYSWEWETVLRVGEGELKNLYLALSYEKIGNGKGGI